MDAPSDSGRAEQLEIIEANPPGGAAGRPLLLVHGALEPVQEALEGLPGGGTPGDVSRHGGGRLPAPAGIGVDEGTVAAIRTGAGSEIAALEKRLSGTASRLELSARYWQSIRTGPSSRIRRGRETRPDRRQDFSWQQWLYTPLLVLPVLGLPHRKR